MVELLAEPDERVGDQQDTDRRQHERERHRASDREGAALRVDVRGHRRRHQCERDADGLPDAELPPQLAGGRRGVRLTDADERVFHAFRHLLPSSS